MTASKADLWRRFQQFYTEFPDLGLALDLSRMNFPDGFFASMKPRMQKAFSAMADLEKGAIANPDEKRMVGHYWLRNPALAPTPAIRQEIEDTIAAIKALPPKSMPARFAGAKVLSRTFSLIGIGGSALGPQFVAHALGQPATDKLTVLFLRQHRP